MAPRLEYADVPTPIGSFRILYEGRTVRWIDLLERGLATTAVPPEAVRRKPPFAAESPPRQLAEYFAGKRGAFDVELALERTTDFDRDVYAQLCRVGPGETVTYGELARRSGHAGAARAVGGAMHRNPIPIVVPCHRVVGETGSLTGYGMGLWRKRWLLQREGAWPLRSRSVEGIRDRAQRTLDDRPSEASARSTA